MNRFHELVQKLHDWFFLKVSWLHSHLTMFLIIFSVYIFFYLLWAVYQYLQVWWMTKDMNIIQFLLPRDNENEPHQMNLAVKTIWKCLPWYIRVVKAQPYFSFEIHATKDFITFNIVTPKDYTEAVEKTVHSVYKDAESNIFAVGSAEDYMAQYVNNSSGGRIKFEKDRIFSLQTFKDWTQDPLSTITSSMTKLDEGQIITLQVLCKPTGDFLWQYLGRKTLKKYEFHGRMPKKFNNILTLIGNIVLFPFKILGTILRLFFLSSQRNRKREETPAEQMMREKGQVELKEQKSISGKVTQHGFRVSIRVITRDVNNNKKLRRSSIRDVANALRQLDAENELNQQHIIIFRKFLRFITVKRFLPLHGSADIMSTEELASLFHLPNKDVMTPNIKRIRSKQAPPPSAASRTENIIGVSRYRGNEDLIGIKERDLDKSIYVLGKQGTGKTALFENLEGQQVRNSTGATIVMDPAGQMARNIIGSTPKDQIKNTYYLNFADFKFPPSLNSLDQSNYRGNNMTLLIEQQIGILKKEFKDSWGPSTEDILRNSITLAMASDGSSLMEVMLAIISEDFRREYLDNLDNFVVRGYWKNEFAKLDNRYKNTIINPPLNKLRRITGNILTRNILCQRKSTVDLAWLFDNKKHVIVNLAKGSIGEENSNFLGSMLLSFIYLLMQEREHTIPDEHLRPKLTLIVDEMQNYVTETVSDMLAELRKYGFRMVAGHQFRSQFDNEEVKSGVYQLSRTKIFFNIGEEDAEYVAPTVAPRFTANDLISLDNYQCVVKMIVDSNEYDAFSLHTIPPMFPVDEEVAKKVVQRSQELFYGGDDAIADIERRYNRFVKDDSDGDFVAASFKKAEAPDPASSVEDKALNNKIPIHNNGAAATDDVKKTSKIKLVYGLKQELMKDVTEIKEESPLSTQIIKNAEVAAAATNNIVSVLETTPVKKQRTTTKKASQDVTKSDKSLKDGTTADKAPKKIRGKDPVETTPLITPVIKDTTELIAIADKLDVNHSSADLENVEFIVQEKETDIKEPSVSTEIIPEVTAPEITIIEAQPEDTNNNADDLMDIKIQGFGIRRKESNK
ncbi:MAG: hypothetical protein JWM44_2109 [Bacilli bacterium]|nr:hypothetical protein [Bacilli bacterium]